MQTNFNVFRRSDAKLDFPDGATTGTVLDKMVDEKYSQEMGGGMFRVHQSASSMILPYDELAICLEGKLLLTVDGTTHELNVGDFAWIPKGTNIVFDGENAVAFYGVYPVDWRARADSNSHS